MWLITSEKYFSVKSSVARPSLQIQCLVHAVSSMLSTKRSMMASSVRGSKNTVFPCPHLSLEAKKLPTFLAVGGHGHC